MVEASTNVSAEKKQRSDNTTCGSTRTQDAISTCSQANFTRMSCCLAWLLRHGAKQQSLTMDSEGYVLLADVLHWLQTTSERRIQRHAIPASWWTAENIRRVVKQDAKQRYRVTFRGSPLAEMIRAEQGHSIALNDIAMLKPITLANCSEHYPATVVHGTTAKKWIKIQQSGYLFAGTRQHIHFAKDATEAAGLRRTSTVLLYVDLLSAVRAGYLFFESGNHVILCSGRPLPPASDTEKPVWDTKTTRLSSGNAFYF